MARRFTTFALPYDLVALAYPLVSAAVPTIDLAGWQNFVQPMIAADQPGSAGAIGLRHEAGYLCGLMVYRTERDLKHGRTLAVDFFVALDLVKETAAARALLEAAEAKALELHCAVIAIRLGIEQHALAHCVNAGGYRPSAKLYAKGVSRPLAN